MHAQMLLILMITVLVAQVVLVEWRKRHFRSYQVRSYFHENLLTKIYFVFHVWSFFSLGCYFVCYVGDSPSIVYQVLF
jgi:RING finger protein 121